METNDLDFNEEIDRYRFVRKYARKVFLGSATEKEERNGYSVLHKHRETANKIWNNEQSNDIGLERVFRLFIMYAQYLFPSLYIRHFFAKKDPLLRHIALEFYVLLKVIYPFMILYYGNLGTHFWLVVLSMYLTFETVLYIASLIFVQEKDHKTYSHRRAFMLICINYLEIVLTFAVIHRFFNTLKGLTTATFDYIYFSFITASTIGFGDFHPMNKIGKGLIILQSIIFMIFLVLVLNFFGSKITHTHKKEKHEK